MNDKYYLNLNSTGNFCNALNIYNLQSPVQLDIEDFVEPLGEVVEEGEPTDGINSM